MCEVCWWLWVLLARGWGFATEREQELLSNEGQLKMFISLGTQYYQILYMRAFAKTLFNPALFVVAGVDPEPLPLRLKLRKWQCTRVLKVPKRIGLAILKEGFIDACICATAAAPGARSAPCLCTFRGKEGRIVSLNCSMTPQMPGEATRAGTCLGSQLTWDTLCLMSESNNTCVRAHSTLQPVSQCEACLSASPTSLCRQRGCGASSTDGLDKA